MSSNLPRLYLITGGAREGDERLERILTAACRGGLRMVQVREKVLSPREMRRLVAWIRSLLPPEVLVIANATGRKEDFLLEVESDGVHIGGGDPAAVREARRALPGEALIGYSAHSEEEISRAARCGADFASLSPVFAPLSKKGHLKPLGIGALRAACRSAPIPVFALGGIHPGSVGSVREAGAWGAACMGAILQAADPESTVRALLSGWDKPKEIGKESGD